MSRKPLITALAFGSATLAGGASLDFDPAQYSEKTVTVNGETITYRAYENIPYVANPVDAAHQTINIYIPAAYYNGGSINGYTATTAPIYLPNQIGGYMPASAGVPGASGFGPKKEEADAMQTALTKGYIVASPGARGRTSADGKAPAAIIDLKAAVRYLKHNDANMAGDAGKIISNGTSAGGALSILLGASGNAPDYDAALKTLGAADAPDDIYAVSAYCPISILDHADSAYEWEFHGVNDYEKIDVRQVDYHVERQLQKGTLSAAEQQTSADLKAQFPAYLNSLNLKNTDGTPLTLDADGNGNFRDAVAAYLGKSAETALKNGQTTAAQLAADHPWLTLDGDRVTAVDFAAYAKTIGRQKTPPAFDALDLSSGENQLFGSASEDKRHFTAYSQAHSSIAGAGMADAAAIKQMNPLHYISDKTAPQHWRIRVGTADRDTSHAIAVILASKLADSGKTVDLAMPWQVPHSGDYDLDELFARMDNVVKNDQP